MLMALSQAAGAYADSGHLAPAQMRDVVGAFSELGFHDTGLLRRMAQGARAPAPVCARRAGAAPARRGGGGARGRPGRPPRRPQPLTRSPTHHPPPAAALPPAAAIKAKLDDFEPPVLAATLASYGAAEFHHADLMAAAAAYLRANADRFDTASLAQVRAPREWRWRRPPARRVSSAAASTAWTSPTPCCRRPRSPLLRAPGAVGLRALRLRRRGGAGGSAARGAQGARREQVRARACGGGGGGARVA
jgi:hypothetical protein